MQPEPRVANPTPTIITHVSSTHVQQVYRLFISLPKSYADSNRAYPIIYLLDGNSTFTLVRDMVEMLQIPQHPPQMPEVIIVGVGYPVDTYMDTLTLRGRDFTFVELTSERKAKDEYPWGETGGARRFLDFLRAELLPSIEVTYRVDPGNRLLMGYSAGAMFILWAMYQQPELFQRLAAIGSGISGIAEEEARYAASHTALPARLFVANETMPPAFEAAMHRLTDALRSRHYDGFEVRQRIYAEEDHFSIFPVAASHALRYLYG